MSAAKYYLQRAKEAYTKEALDEHTLQAAYDAAVKSHRELGDVMTEHFPGGVMSQTAEASPYHLARQRRLKTITKLEPHLGVTPGAFAHRWRLGTGGVVAPPEAMRSLESAIGASPPSVFRPARLARAAEGSPSIFRRLLGASHV